jgi:hypothetical protein
MHVGVCFPFFDTRFLHEDADGASKPAPRWLYSEPPPPLAWVGRLGRVDKWIPPLPYARCSAAELIAVQPQSVDAAARVDLELVNIEVMADQGGHGRLSIWLEAKAQGCDGRLELVVEQIARREVAVRHPDRRDVYEILAEAGDSLADLYGIESARTAPIPHDDYRGDWVVAARPFMIFVNTRREAIDAGPKAIAIQSAGSAGSLSFLPWRSPDGDIALPVWYLDAPRGGDAWRQPVEAVEDLNARYEELFSCLLLKEEMDADNGVEHNFAVYLARHCKRIAAGLRRTQRHGVDLQAVLRLVSDYDRSQLNPRETPKYAAALLDRISREVADTSRSRSGTQTFIIRRLDMTINSSGQGNVNIINLGEMITGTISTTNTMLAESQAAPKLKEQVEALRQPVVEAAKALPEAEAKMLLEDYEDFTKAALRPEPRKEVVKAQGNQILNTLKKVAEYAEPAGKIIGAIFKIVAIF